MFFLIRIILASVIKDFHSIFWKKLNKIDILFLLKVWLNSPCKWICSWNFLWKLFLAMKWLLTYIINMNKWYCVLLDERKILEPATDDWMCQNEKDAWIHMSVFSASLYFKLNITLFEIPEECLMSLLIC